MGAICRLAWCAIVSVGLSPSGFVPPEPQPVADRIAFVGVSVLPMSTDTLLPDQTVLVEDGIVTRHPISLLECHEAADNRGGRT